MPKKLLLLSVLVMFLVSGGSNKDTSAQDPATIFECNYFRSPEPGLKAELFAPDMFKGEDHQHSSPTFMPDGKEIYWSYGKKIPDTRKRVQLIVFSRYENGQWSEPAIVSFSGQYSEGGPFISPDGKRMFFYSTRPLTPGGNPNNNDDLWYVERSGDGWGDPQHLDFCTDANETMPSVSARGTLYFVAQYDGKEAAFQIYYSELKEGAYSEPVKAGRINRGFHMSPFIAPDESYIVYATLNSSLSISRKRDDGSWGNPVNLGSKINTGTSQRFCLVSPDGKYLFFTSYAGGKEQRYWMSAAILGE